ncbi:MAG: VWA domain-containing protein [Alphaproteobacteria bacterium]|nr:VWA domain-containing protein [Alphaproteobacteria bacterium]
MPEQNGAPEGRLADNILHFGRVLRAAGLPVGPGTAIEAIRAVETVGLRDKDDFYWGLHAVFVNRRDQHEVFNQAFHIIWRKPDILARVLGAEMPALAAPAEAEQASRRVSEALGKESPRDDAGPEEREIEIDASFTYSAQEILQKIDFESMSIEELAQAKQVIARMRLPVAEVRTRRYGADPRGPRIDMRRSFRAGLRYGGSLIPLRRRARLARRPPLVVLCDISGSMSNYSRMFLHFLHAITNDRDRVHTFLFGTRLTNVTRHLRHKDVDVALAKVRDAVEDWSGGTRIGRTLREFNLVWSRRVLGQGALVLLVSDGLDRDAGVGLAAEIERLHKSCRRLIWLNPLLRYREFEAKSSGIKVIIQHIDDFRPVHSLENLSDLGRALAGEWTNDFDVADYLSDEDAAPRRQRETVP